MYMHIVNQIPSQCPIVSLPPPRGPHLLHSMISVLPFAGEDGVPVLAPEGGQATPD